nr:RecName: Full=Toxin TdII-1 [Tityus discrepans]AAB47866.1 TdII-1=muscarinic toxin {N-terminal} [Tityus discrepans, venom, Peptide Partial, 26 aa] [Tityus discrepans]
KDGYLMGADGCKLCVLTAPYDYCACE